MPKIFLLKIRKGTGYTKICACTSYNYNHIYIIIFIYLYLYNFNYNYNYILWPFCLIIHLTFFNLNFYFA